ncbi:MAG: hypothetical protein FRX48_01621 [Lasallia pustulata]|uniref:Uncharacterized protein n=1 Tax=Lasallia pustulata TaxID=136370 RepID=A0A5M8PYN8_9LECA|nr:MAG: hypothetical protein FRX48_01621 [Lasallia pustulata]
MAEAYPNPADTMAGYEDVFHPLDAVALEQDGSISPLRAGTRKVNKRRLNKSSEDYPEPTDLALAVSEPSPDDLVIIPELLFSVQTYEYCGFTSAVAGRLWDLYQKNKDEFPEFDNSDHRNYFLSFAFAFIDEVPEPSAFQDQEWNGALQTMGFDSRTQDAIMLKEFTDLRCTESANYWAKDTVDIRLGGLEEVKRVSWERSQQADRRMQRAECEERPSVVSRIPGMAIETAKDAKQNAPGSTVLWKGLAQHRTAGLFTPGSIVQDFCAIVSNPPSDFSLSGSYYWAVDKEIAMRYIKWASNKMAIGECVLLRLEVANNLIEPLQAPVLQYPSNLWKQHIYSCRRQHVPKELRYLLSKTLLIGHIGTGTTAIANLRDWRDIDVRHTLRRKSDNGIATQYVFSGLDGLDFLIEHCSGSLAMYRSGDQEL